MSRALTLLSNNLLSAAMALMRASFPTGYAWVGQDATLAAWVDRMQDVNAAPGGSGTTLGALNGRACPVFSGAGYYRTAAFASAIAQPYTTISVSRLDGVIASFCVIHDGLNPARGRLAHRAGPQSYATADGSNAINGADIGTNAAALTATFNAATSAIYRGSTLLGSGNVGAGALTGLTVGASMSSTLFFIGPIAAVFILPGAAAGNAAAAQIAALLQRYYKI